MKAAMCCLFVGAAVNAATGAVPAGVEADDRLLQLGCLDVTKTQHYWPVYRPIVLLGSTLTFGATLGR